MWDTLRKDGSVGKILPFLDARIIDKDNNSLPPGEVGELICRGPNVMQGYHRNPRATGESLVYSNIENLVLWARILYFSISAIYSKRLK